MLADGSRIEARHYVDASGNAAVLRKAMGVDVSEPTALRNIAVWDYWQNAEWADKIGVGGTMVQVLSIPTGWIWFIPLSPTRTSIGFICPSEYYKASGKSTEQLYLEALPQDDLIVSLIRNATREGNLQATKDWSFLSERMAGENWFLAGETAGFADPILAAGMTLAQLGAREAAYIILELERGDLDPAGSSSTTRPSRRNGSPSTSGLPTSGMPATASSPISRNTPRGSRRKPASASRRTRHSSGWAPEDSPTMFRARPVWADST